MKTKWLNRIGLIAALMMGKAMAQTVTVTAKEAVDFAFKNVIDLKNSQIDYKLQAAKNKEYTAAAYPQINGTVGMNHYLSLPTIGFANSKNPGKSFANVFRAANAHQAGRDLCEVHQIHRQLLLVPQ